MQGSLQLDAGLRVRAVPEAVSTIDLNWSIGPVTLPLEGEEEVPVINDCVDLTPYMREDILLAFPQHPLCEPDCGGLQAQPGQSERTSGASRSQNRSVGLG